MRRKGLFQYKQFSIVQQHAAMKVGTWALFLRVAIAYWTLVQAQVSYP